jgi:hypothetical protein
VEHAYGEVRMPRKPTEAVREKLNKALAGRRAQAEAESTRQRHRIAKLTEEREKLLRAYYAGAVPIDLLRQEQDRLTAETNQAERQLEVAEASFVDIEDTLGKALDLLADCKNAYWPRPGTCGVSGTRRSLSDSSSTTTTSKRRRSPSPSRRWLTLNSLPSWMVRPPRKPPLLLTAVQMTVLSSGRQDQLGFRIRLKWHSYHLRIPNSNRLSSRRPRWPRAR